MPAASSSKVLQHFPGRTDMLVQLVISVLGVVRRDAVLRGYAANLLEQTGRVLVVARSVEPADLPSRRDETFPAAARARKRHTSGGACHDGSA